MNKLRLTGKRQKAKGNGQISKIMESQEGIALLMALVLCAIALAVMATLLYMLISGTQTSGIQRRYKSALDAATGGAEVAYQVVANRGANSGNPFDSSMTTWLGYVITAPTPSGGLGNCLNDYKLQLSTDSWHADCNKLTAINPGDTTTYDFRVDLGGGLATSYRVYGKIVDTVIGNSSSGASLIKGGVVSANTGEVTAQSVPYLYTIEIDSENSANPAERSKLSILYQY